MRKVIYIDIISPTEHLNYNNGILRNFPKGVMVDICARENYIKKEVVNYHEYFSIPNELLYKYDQNRKMTQVYMRFKMFEAIKWVEKKINFKKYDVVVWAFIDEIIFSLFCRKNNKRTLFMDHLIGNIEENNIKKFFFKRINRSYEFIAFEDYIADYVKGVDPKRRTWILSHPLPQLEFRENAKKITEEKLIFAPALSNDEQFIDYLIDNETRIPEKVKIIIRSTEKTFKSNKLEVYSKRISDSEYIENIKKSSVILIHYGEHYNYRTSGILYEAVKLRKPIYMYCKNTMNSYREKYPEVIYAFYDNEEFIQNIYEVAQKLELRKNTAFDRILNDYSDEKIRQQLIRIFDGEDNTNE